MAGNAAFRRLMGLPKTRTEHSRGEKGRATDQGKGKHRSAEQKKRPCGESGGMPEKKEENSESGETQEKAKSLCSDEEFRLVYQRKEGPLGSGGRKKELKSR